MHAFKRKEKQVWGLVKSREMAFQEGRVNSGPPMVLGSVGWLLPIAWVHLS